MQNILVIILVLYVVITQVLINGYETKIDKMLNVNTSLLKSCILLSSGEDLNTDYRN